MADVNDGRVSSVLLFPEYLPSAAGQASTVLLFPEYLPSATGQASTVLLFPEYMPSLVVSVSSLLLMVEYIVSPDPDVTLVQAEEMLQITALQGQDLTPGPGQIEGDYGDS
jgi:hypothetical protein